MPIVQTSTYSFADTAEIVAYTEGRHPDGERGEYGRYGNPTVRAVEQRLAALEGTEDAALFSSGMAAVTTSTLALVKGGAARRPVPGLLPDDARVRDRRARALRRGAHARSPAGDVAALPDALRPETRLVLSESPTNPYLSCVDLERLAAACKSQAHGQVDDRRDLRDAGQLPAGGASASISSSTARRSTSRATTTCSRASCAGPRGLVSIIRDLRGVLGAVCDPHAAFLVGRGLKTLTLRVERQNATALALAAAAREAPADRARLLPRARRRTRATRSRVRRCAASGASSASSSRAASPPAAAMVDAVKLARIGPSFGGVESLIEQPAVMSYYEMTTEQRAGDRDRRRPRASLGRHRGHGRHHRRHRAGALGLTRQESKNTGRGGGEEVFLETKNTPSLLPSLFSLSAARLLQHGEDGLGGFGGFAGGGRGFVLDDGLLEELGGHVEEEPARRAGNRLAAQDA